MAKAAVKSVETLIKIAQQRLIKQQQRISPIQEKIQGIEERIDFFKSEKERERAFSDLNPLVNINYLQYAETIDNQIRQLIEELKKQEHLLKIEQERLSKIFQDKKVLEVYRDRKIEQAKRALEEWEQKELDELGLRLSRQESVF